MNSRVALAVFVSLILTVAVGWLSAPDRPDTYTYAKPTAAQFDPADTAASTGSPATTTAIVLAFMIAGAAAIGLAFFSPRGDPRPHMRAAAEIAEATTDFVSTRKTRRARPDAYSHPTGGPERDVVAPTYRPKFRGGAGAWANEWGHRLNGAPISSFVERTRCGLADLHQELEVVLGLLQTVDQQIDRLVRVQAGQYAAQFVQHRGLVGAEQ